MGRRAAAGGRRGAASAISVGVCYLLFPVAQDDDVAVIAGDDVGGSRRPRRLVLAGPWCAWWRGGGQSVVISVTAARALCSSTMFLCAGPGGDQGLGGEVVDGAGQAAGGVVDQRDGVVAEQGVGAAGELEVVGDVPAGLVGCQGGHGVAQGDPLVQGGQHAEAEHPAQGGLAEEQAGQRAGRVHLGVWSGSGRPRAGRGS